MTLAADLTAALRPVVNAMVSLKASYYVTGSVASSVFGAIRATNDIDIVSDLPIEQAEKFFKMLKEQYYIDLNSIQEAITNKRSFNVVHLESAFKLDIFVAKTTEIDRAMLDRASIVDIGTKQKPLLVKFASPEDLILSKLRWYRDGGELSVQQLKDVQGILNVQPSIDFDYLKGQAEKLGLRDLLDSVLSK